MKKKDRIQFGELQTEWRGLSSSVPEDRKGVNSMYVRRTSRVVAVGAGRLSAEAHEVDLNQAILDLGREDFLTGDLDLMALFSLSLERFYSDDFVQSLGTEETNGRSASFRHLANLLEPIHTLLEMGMAVVETFRVTGSLMDAEGNSISDWEAVLGGTYSTGITLRWRTVRAWRNGMVTAERIDELRPEGLSDSF